MVMYIYIFVLYCNLFVVLFQHILLYEVLYFINVCIFVVQSAQNALGNKCLHTPSSLVQLIPYI